MANCTELFTWMREDINNAKNQGLVSFTVDQLFSWVDRVEIAYGERYDDSEDLSPEEEQERIKREHEYKVNMTKWVEDLKHYNASQIEVFKGAIKFAEIALKSAILINGGAAVAFLAFIGTIWTGTSEHPESILKLTGPLMMFTWGVFLGAVSCGLSYLTQICYAEGAPKWANIIRVFAVIFVIGTYACFGYGASAASDIFAISNVDSFSK